MAKQTNQEENEDREFLAGLFHRFVLNVAPTLSRYLVPSVSSDGLLVDLGEGERWYSLAEAENGAYPDRLTDWWLVTACQSLVFYAKTDPEKFDYAVGWALLGIMAWDKATDSGREQLEAKIKQFAFDRALGGHATRKLTGASEATAREYIAAELRPGVSKTTACKRAKGRLLKDHGIGVSVDTLLRILRSPK